MFLSRGIKHAKLGPDFQRVWASVTVSSLGDGMRFVALPLLAAQLTSDPRQVTFVYVAEQLPLLLFGLLSGAIADRFDRRSILWVVDAVRAVIVGVLAVAIAADAMTVPLLAGIGFLLGLGQTLYNGAWSGIVPTLVASPELTRANARLQSGSLITDTLLGTPLGALLFGVCATLPFAVDAVSFAAAAVLALTLSGDFRPRPQITPNPWRRLLDDTTQGVRWLWQQPLLRRLCLTSGITNFVGGGLIAILVLYARHTLGLTKSRIRPVGRLLRDRRRSGGDGDPSPERPLRTPSSSAADCCDHCRYRSGCRRGLLGPHRRRVHRCVRSGEPDMECDRSVPPPGTRPCSLTGTRRHGLPDGHRRRNHARRCPRGS